MDNKMNTVIDYEFQDGSRAEMTLSFYKLYQLRGKNPMLYKRYVAAINKGKAIEELDMITIMYVAYVCANMGVGNVMDEEEFMMKCGSDRKAVTEGYRKLTQPKKQKDSRNHSSSEQGKESIQ